MILKYKIKELTKITIKISHLKLKALKKGKKSVKFTIIIKK